MRIGALCSSGGGAFLAAAELLTEENIVAADGVKILADRQCGAIEAAKQKGIPYVVHQWTTSEEFSRKAYEEFFGYDLILLFFTRIIGPELTRKLPVVNIHPSLLPGLPGFRALEKAHRSGCKFVAATAHLATAAADSGSIIAQTILPVAHGTPLPTIEALSFLQKVYLATCVADLLNQGCLSFAPAEEAYTVHKPLAFSSSCNPAYASAGLNKKFCSLLQERGAQGFAL